MKELSIEEKAKRYDEAIERAKNTIEVNQTIPDIVKCVESLFPELAESEDERMRKEIIEFVKNSCFVRTKDSKHNREQMLAWLEKQGEHVNFRNKIQIGDKVTRNEDGVLVNLSQLNRVAKKQVEQKPADKVELKFKVGDFIVNDYCAGKVVEITNDAYLLDTEQGIPFSSHSTRLWDITKDANDGDVLCYKDEISLYKHDIKNCTKQETTFGGFVYYCCYDGKRFIVDSLYSLTEQDKMDIHPATKEQRDQLEKAMVNAGYTFDFEKKELKKIEQKYTPIEQNVDNKKLQDIVIEEINKYGGNESYKAPWALDSTGVQYPFYFAELGARWQKEQKSAEWSIFDYRTWQYIVSDVLTKKDGIGQYLDNGECKKIAKYMQEEWSKKLSVEQRTTELPKGQDYGIDGLYAAVDILTKTLGEVDGYQSDDGILEHKCAISAVKELSKQKSTWSEEDEKMLNDILMCGEHHCYLDTGNIGWLKSIKDRVQPQPKQEWKQENIEELSDFESLMLHIGSSFFGQNAGLDPNNTACVKEQAQLLLDANQKIAWSEEEIEKAAQEWDSKANFKPFYISPTGVKQDVTTHKESFKAGINWILKSLKTHNTWKPSNEQMERLKGIINSLPHQKVLYSLYQDLKKLKS